MVTTPPVAAPAALIQQATATDSRCVSQGDLNAVTVDPGHPGVFIPVGYDARFDHPVIFILKSYCDALEQRKDFWRLGAAVFIVAHERQHALGEMNEDKADCGAAKTFFYVASMLGVHGRSARRAAQSMYGLAGYHPKKTNSCWTSAAVPTFIVKGK